MVTRNDVARHAGVSVAVVSYVLNNKSFVKEATRRKVLQSMEELGYQPNHTARSLKTKKNYQLAVLTNYIGNPFEAGILLHLEEAASRFGYMITYQTCRPGREEEMKSLLAGRVDGIILLGQSLKEETHDFFGKRDIPLVSVMRPAAAPPSLFCADVDWTAAYTSLIRLLAAEGHRRIAFMTHGNPLDTLAHRMDCFRQAMAAAGSAQPLDCMELHGEGRYEGAYKLLTEFPGQPEVTAIVCANDLMAIGTVAACRQRGWNVPSGIAVAGSENILMTVETHPPIAVLDYPRQQAAYSAFEHLLARMTGSSALPEPVSLNAPFIRRESIGL
ncbi:MAG: catabolite control protein [Paenibacillaceae bacterium]|jgi:DNA-binding LacI/PurR family transcriptional regulator|nr:catabolite control protein [Paenibacillaceae bacterium]